MYVAYGLYVMDFTLVVMNQTTKVTYIAWAVSDFYTKKNIELKMKLQLWLNKQTGGKFEGFGEVESTSAGLQIA